MVVTVQTPNTLDRDDEKVSSHPDTQPVVLFRSGTQVGCCPWACFPKDGIKYTKMLLMA